MRTLHFYLLRQVMAALLMTVLVFTFILLLGNVLKEILALLVNRQASLGIVCQAILLLIPFVWIFALPMGMLTATLLVFGRFSADQELTAVRANGISLIALITPVLLLSVLLSGICGVFNTEVSQKCRAAYKKLIRNLGEQNPSSFITEGRFINDFKGYLLYVGKVNGPQLEDILISQLENDKVTHRIRASSGFVEMDTNNLRMTLFLTNYWGFICKTNETGWTPFMDNKECSLSFDIPATSRSVKPMNYSDMTLKQLWAEKEALEQLEYAPFSSTRLSPETLREQLALVQRFKKDTLMPILVQISRQVAFSFACIGFTLIGIPLGIKAHRRETSVGIGIAIVLVLLYYGFIVLAKSFDTRPEFAPHLIVWLPNFLFQAIGAVLLWRVNRGI